MPSPFIYIPHHPRLRITVVCYFILILFSNTVFSIDHKLETINLQLKWRHQFQFAGYYAAKEKGFYADEGLDVQFHERTLDINVVNQVVSGVAEYGVGDSGILADYANGQPIKALAAIFQHNPLVFISKQSSSIVSPYEMIGKQVMIDREGRDNAPLLAMLHDADVSDKQYTFIKHSMNDKALINDEADVMTAYISNQPYYYKKLGIDINIINPQNYGFDFYGDLLFTSQAELLAYPGRADRFKRASLKGWQYAMAHPEEVIRIIVDQYAPHADVEALRYEAKTMRKLILPETIKLGKIEVNRLRRVANTYFRLKLSEPLNDAEIQGFIHRGIEDLNLSPKERTWLVEHPVIRVGIKPDFAPYEWLDEDGQYVGMAADYMHLLEQKLGRRFNFIKGETWAETVQMVKQGEIELLASFIQSPERDQQFNVSETYAVSPVVIVSRDDIKLINSLDMLANKTVVVKQVCFWREWLEKNYPELKLRIAADSMEAFQWVATGKADVFIADATHATYIIKNTHLLNLHLATTMLDFNRYRIATLKAQPELSSIINKVLASIDKEQKKQLTDKWMALKVEPGIQFEKLIKYIIGLALLFVVFSYWIYQLRRSEKAFKQQGKKMSAIFEASNDAIFLLKDQRVFDCNQRAVKLFKLESKEQVIETELIYLFSEQQTGSQRADFIIKKHLNKGLTEGVSHFEWLCRQVDNEYFPADIQLSSYQYNQQPFLLLSIRDITERKKIEHREFLKDQALKIARKKQLISNQELKFQKNTLDQHVIISICNVKGEISYINDKFCEISGYSKAELIGQHHRIIKSDEHPESLYTEMWETISNGGVWQGELKNKAKDGSFYWVNVTIVPQLDSQTKPIQYIAMRTDITQLKRLERKRYIESEDALIRAKISQLLLGQATLKDRIKQALAILVQASELKLQNKAGIFLIPEGEEDLVMYSVHGQYEEFMQKEHCVKAGHCLCGRVAVSGFLKVSDNCFTDHEHEHTFEGMKAHGHYIVPLKFSGRVLGVLFIYTDPTPSRDPTRLSLLTQIGELLSLAIVNDRINKALQAEKDHADKASKAKSEFLSSMSHELRTPLNAILGFTQLLEMDSDEPLTEIQQESVHFISSGGKHLLKLINEVLELSTIEAGKVELFIEPISLIACLKESLSLVESSAVQNSIELQLLEKNTEILILADDTKLKQVLLNLFSNAIKYNRQGGSVTIDCENMKQQKIRISVIDTGMGISASKQQNVFTEFNRLGYENSTIEGTGIGLVVTKNLVKLMGGCIGFDSIEGKGTTFWVEFPIAKTEVDITNAIPPFNEPIKTLALIKADEVPIPTKQILYIEDNPANGQLMEAFFNRQKNLTLQIAETAEIAYQQLLEQPVDLILMDIHLPKMTGKELAEILKKNQHLKNIPIIAVTAVAIKEDMMQSNNVFDSYLTKPVDFALLTKTLKKHLMLS